MVATDQNGTEPVISDRLFAKMDPWLRSLDPLSEFVFRMVMLRRCHRISTNRRFAKRYEELRGRLTPTEAEQAVLLKRAKHIEARLAALLPGT
jgi:hypothetical protein